MFLSLVVCVRRGPLPEASAGATEGRGLWRCSVELWQLHLPQPPCSKPLWTMRDASLHLILTSHCHTPVPPLPITPAANPCSTPLESAEVDGGCCSCYFAPPRRSRINHVFKTHLPAEEEPPDLPAHLSCFYLLLLCTLILKTIFRVGWRLQWRLKWKDVLAQTVTVAVTAHEKGQRKSGVTRGCGLPANIPHQKTDCPVYTTGSIPELLRCS